MSNHDTEWVQIKKKDMFYTKNNDIDVLAGYQVISQIHTTRGGTTRVIATTLVENDEVDAIIAMLSEMGMGGGRKSKKSRKSKKNKSKKFRKSCKSRKSHKK